jgi:type I restriction enzyme S subunit
VKKLGYIFNSLNTKRIPLSAEERGVMTSKIYDYYGASGVIDKVDGFLFDENLILIGEDGANLLTRSKRLAFIASGKYWVNNHAHIIKPIDGNLNYYCEFLELIDYTIYITGSAQPKLTQEALMSIKIIEPPISEQSEIANYLDHKTTQIDTLISKKQQFISLLQEERIAVINQAVTKGLDPKVKMKDSGIAWLGEIPEHWEIKKLKYVGNCQNGISEGAEFFGTGHPFVSYSDVYKNEILPKNVFGLANSNEKHQEHYSVEENDVFFTRTSETIEEIGIASICYDKIEKAVFAGFLIRFRPNTEIINKEFSKYYFRCFIPRTFFVKEMNLVTRASLSQELLKRLPIILPSINEQQRISTFLDKKTSGIDTVISKSKQEIELLKEYKTALISEVVTGKVDVRDVVLN